jgi:alkylated DNA repair dioxygenase AlkB
MTTITVTFGDQAENHVGMEKLGNLASEGFRLEELENAKDWFEEKGIVVEITNLSNNDLNTGDAYLLVAKNGLSSICETNEFFKEQNELDQDKKAYMYGRVVNKRARYNLCFDDDSHEPDYEKGKGRVYSFQELPNLNKVRETFPKIIGKKARGLKAEGNYYYDIKKTGIGFHGDSERRLVIGVRVGEDLLLRYHWFQKSKPIGKPIDFILGHGDIYIMSEKAVGTDWKKKLIPTLRHSAGCEKFTRI